MTSGPARGSASLWALLLRALLVALALIAESPARAQERLSIVTTTNDLRSLAEAVGGERVAVAALVPPGFDPEEYQPRPQDLARVRQARVVVRVGLDFDLWLDRLLAQVGGNVRRGAPGYVDASFGIAALDVRGMSIGDAHGHGSGNPHYWLDPRNAEIITANILAALVGIDPESAAIYEANRIAFLSRLESKIKEWETQLAAVRGVPLVAYHNSWPYFARRFRLEFIGTLEPKPGVPPSPAHLASLIGMMNARGARIIVRQPHEPEKDVGFVAKRTGSVVAVLASSVGALPGADDYFSLFDVNVAALRAAAGVR